MIFHLSRWLLNFLFALYYAQNKRLQVIHKNTTLSSENLISVVKCKSTALSKYLLDANNMVRYFLIVCSKE